MLETAIFLLVAYADVSLLSQGAGGGYLALRVFYSDPRFPDGSSPACVIVPGGNDTGDLDDPRSDWLNYGIVWVKFLFPGGYDAGSGRSSDGVYDYRGMNCLRALRDVILFCEGALKDSLGRTIDQIVGFQVEPDNVGILALSNGGSISTVVTSIFGDSMAFPVWMAGWENPTNGQIQCVDLCNRDNDSTRDGDGDGNYNNDYFNPRYMAYGDTVLSVDYSQIAYDSINPPPSGGLFLDGNGNGSFDVVFLPGGPSPDLDSSGLLETDEDFSLSSYPDTGGVDVYSNEATMAVALKGIFSPWPRWLADTAEARAYWNVRQASEHYDSNTGTHAVILVFSRWDHVQANDDKPHVHMAFHGFLRAGAWVRLNPDSSYSSYVSPSYPYYPDNPAFWEPGDWNDIEDYAYGDYSPYPDGFFQLAAVLELSDRTHYGVWDPDLNDMIGVKETRRATRSSELVPVVKGKMLLLKAASPGELVIRDVSGRPVLRKTFGHAGTYIADLSDLTPGVYFATFVDARATLMIP